MGFGFLVGSPSSLYTPIPSSVPPWSVFFLFTLHLDRSLWSCCCSAPYFQVCSLVGPYFGAKVLSDLSTVYYRVSLSLSPPTEFMIITGVLCRAFHPFSRHRLKSASDGSSRLSQADTLPPPRRTSLN